MRVSTVHGSKWQRDISLPDQHGASLALPLLCTVFTLSSQNTGRCFVGASLALEHRADCVVAMGGAAVIDAAKAIAAIVYADKDSAKAAGRLLAAATKPRCVFMYVYSCVCLCLLIQDVLRSSSSSSSASQVALSVPHPCRVVSPASVPSFLLASSFRILSLFSILARSVQSLICSSSACTLFIRVPTERGRNPQHHHLVGTKTRPEKRQPRPPKRRCRCWGPFPSWQSRSSRGLGRR